MIRNITVGIDVGTYATRVVVCEHLKEEPLPRILGTGITESRGLRHGYIVHMEEAITSIKQAISQAEKTAGVKITRAFLAIGGISLGAETTTGSAIISRADKEVTDRDIQKAFDDSQNQVNKTNKKIIFSSPISYKIDGEDIFGRPEGLQGIKLETRSLFVTCLSQHFEDMITAVTEAGVEVIDIVPAPLASAVVTLTVPQKMAGCALVDIGSETVSIAVFENNTPISMQVFSIGSTDITKDIALGLRVSLEEAEHVKRGTITHNYPQRKLSDIIEARLTDIFELIETHLKKIHRSALLPGGVIITGGGAHLAVIEQLSKKLLKLPAKIATAEAFSQSKNKIKDPAWFTAIGLCLLQKEYLVTDTPNTLSKGFNSIRELLKNTVKQLLP